MAKNKRKTGAKTVVEKKTENSKTNGGKGLRTGVATLTICAAALGAYYSPYFRTASNDRRENGPEGANADALVETNAATASAEAGASLAQAPSFRDFLNDEYGEEEARELLGDDAASEAFSGNPKAGTGFADYVAIETNALESVAPKGVASDGWSSAVPAVASVPESGANFADYVAAENVWANDEATGVGNALESDEAQGVASDGRTSAVPTVASVPESGASFADYVAAENALATGAENDVENVWQRVETKEVASDLGPAAVASTSEAGAGFADYVAAKPDVERAPEGTLLSVEKTRLASAVEPVATNDANENEAALAARLENEMKERGVGNPRIERWGGRFWRASGFATTGEGVATFCEAVDVDPASAQRTALSKFDAARF